MTAQTIPASASTSRAASGGARPAAVFRAIRFLLAGYLAISVAAVAVIVVMGHDAALVTSAVRVHGIIVAAAAVVAFALAGVAARGSRGAYLRLRVISVVTVAAIAVTIALPGSFPVWMKAEQGAAGLLLSTVAALVAAGAQHTWPRFELGLPAVAATAIWWAVVAVRFRPDASDRWRLMVFTVHTALAAYLVWVSLPYGVFAYSGFVLAYGLGSRWRAAGFAASALIVSAAMTGGYPSGNGGQTATYLGVAVVLAVLTMNSANVMTWALEQNQERGRVIIETGRGEPASGSLDGRECRTARTAGGPGPGGRNH